jgi:hypothetical protein
VSASLTSPSAYLTLRHDIPVYPRDFAFACPAPSMLCPFLICTKCSPHHSNLFSGAPCSQRALLCQNECSAYPVTFTLPLL